ncbi:MAG: hypothetical protein EYC70_08595 [Planctomycetota bacterium]|nr:MAG: hypothetical protein EYC70_08595 [Planctomycetota bacterium]
MTSLAWNAAAVLCLAATSAAGLLQDPAQDGGAQPARGRAAAPASQGKDRPLVGALAYLWHRKEKPQEINSLTPEHQPYDTSDPATARHNIRLWKEAGVDFVAGEWWGLGPNDWYQHMTDSFENYLKLCEEEKFRICVYLDDIPGAKDHNSAEKLAKNLKVIAKWAQSPAFLRYGPSQRPLVFLYERVLQKLGKGKDNQALEEALQPYQDEFYFVFVNVPAESLAKREQPAGVQYYAIPFMQEPYLIEQYEAARSSPKVDLFALVFHGFDNTGHKGREGRKWPSSPEKFQHQWEIARQARPEVIMVPWDELGEWSAYVPNKEQGDRYYKLLKEAIGKL